MTDTIYAPATPPGRGGVAVIRVSGPGAWTSLSALTNAQNITPRQATLCTLQHPVSRETIDRALVLGFKKPMSYTGENVVEYHVHGGHAVIQDMLHALSEQPGHRMAEPGEFTRRAFENGKMDLTAAEAVADLIDAETQAQKNQALDQMGGALASLYRDWTDRLKRSLAHLEADIEFPDEDMPGGIAPQVTGTVERLIKDITGHLDDNRRGERLRDGIQIAVIGAPNVGKSSLVNALARRDVAIVSDMAGTTRDIIEVHLDLGGYPVILADTAGLRPDQIGSEGQEAIESEGIRRALDRAQKADIKLLIFDGEQTQPDNHTLDLIDEHSIVVINKQDLIDSHDHIKKMFDAVHETVVFASAIKQDDLDNLLSAIMEIIKTLVGGQNETPSLTRKRHRRAVEDCQTHLTRSLKAPLPELMAEDMRLAIRALGRITGHVDVEDVLDVVFKDFCIGK